MHCWSRDFLCTQDQSFRDARNAVPRVPARDGYEIPYVADRTRRAPRRSRIVPPSLWPLNFTLQAGGMFCKSSHSLLVLVFCGLCTLLLVRSAFAHEQNVLDEPWGRLRERVAGRLYSGFPLASPCFSSDLNIEASPSCEAVEVGYLNECKLTCSSR